MTEEKGEKEKDEDEALRILILLYNECVFCHKTV